MRFELFPGFKVSPTDPSRDVASKKAEPAEEADRDHDNDSGDEQDDWCDTCNNMGIIDCLCGGDMCICMNHGEINCPDCGD
jgi:hypothetical protein